MSTDRDTTRIVRSWLRVDENESADRVLGTVLDRLDTTPQRRAISTRRLPDMSYIVRYAAVAAVVAMAAVIGYSVVAGPPEVGPLPIPSASAGPPSEVVPSPGHPRPARRSPRLRCPNSSEPET